MKTIIEDIRQKIANNFYSNEEHIRLNIVLRLLEKLGWDIWNPKEVCAEFFVSPDEDKTKVDLALFVNNYSPSVFIEIKYLGKIFDKLSQIEKQLRNYNRDNTAIFSIITDGRVWRFYYSQTGGEFSQKCFKQLDLLKDDIEDIELHLLTFLSKTEIQNGAAEREASKYLTLSQKQKAMEDAIPQARRLIQEPPYPSLPEALINIIKESGITISIDEAIEYIKTTPIKRTDNIEQPNVENKVTEKSRPIQHYDNAEDFRFTKILLGRVEKDTSKSWNQLLRIAIKYSLDKGMTLDDLYNIINVNIKSGLFYEHGFRPIPDKNYSMQDVESTKAAINLKKLVQKSKLSLYVEFEWREKSPNAGKKGIIKINAI
uniref:Restriction endonuclease type I HsdR N-terminal domain-containing protein n=1 Tax=Ignavibacterium album TaxID=591197 RepID=A0A832G908_9BACT